MDVSQIYGDLNGETKDSPLVTDGVFQPPGAGAGAGRSPPIAGGVIGKLS